VLDTLSASDKSFVLRTDYDGALRGLASRDVVAEFGGLLGKTVVVEGVIYFDPSGRPVRMEADHIAEAQSGDELWACVPRRDIASRPAPASTANIGELYGKWPGEETDAEIFAALAELS
jgi:hypothetical protein